MSHIVSQAELPKVLHTYQNHHLDSTRWERFVPRADDIVISTSYKSGTTLTQEILRQLIFHDQEPSTWQENPLWQVSPWLDNRTHPLEEIIERLEAQSHRRFIKTHLPLDGLIFFPQSKYVVVGRDPCDVFMSFWNHYSNYTPVAYERYNFTPDRVGTLFPECPKDIHETWFNWITRGWFEWESEGYPFWGNMHHSQSWWNYRHLANIHFVHYNDLLTDLDGEVSRIADFLGIVISDQAITSLIPNLSLEAMRSKEALVNVRFQQIWKDGAQSFFFKGTNGRWQEALSADELVLYDEAASRILTPACRQWLEQGRVALAQHI